MTALALDRVIDRLAARLVAGGPFPGELPGPARPGHDPDRFDRVLAESARAPLVLRFEGAALPGGERDTPASANPAAGHTASRNPADDLDRLRIELESALIRVPSLRARPVERIEIAFVPGRPAGDLAAFLRAVRRPLPGAAAAPVIAELRELSPHDLPAREVAAILGEAGCTHASVRGVSAAMLLPLAADLRSAGFRGIAAEVGAVELRSAPALLGERGPDGIAIGSPLEPLPASQELLRERLHATIRAAADLRAEGWVDAAPRGFLRGGRLPGFAAVHESATRLGFGPGALRHAGAPLDLYLWRSDPDPAAWAEAIDHGRIPPGSGHRPGEDERLRRFAIRSLLGTGRLDVVELERRGRVDFIHRFEDDLAALEERQHDGLVECDPDEIRATELGRVAIEDIAGCFVPERRERERRAGL